MYMIWNQIRTMQEKVQELCRNVPDFSLSKSVLLNGQMQKNEIIWNCISGTERRIDRL